MRLRIGMAVATASLLVACGQVTPGAITTADGDTDLSILRHGGGGRSVGHRGGHWGSRRGWRHDGRRHGWRHDNWRQGFGWRHGLGWRHRGWNRSWAWGLPSYAYGFPGYSYTTWIAPLAGCNPQSPWYPDCLFY